MTDWRYDYDPSDESDTNVLKRWRDQDGPLRLRPPGPGRRWPTVLLIIAAFIFVGAAIWFAY